MAIDRRILGQIVIDGSKQWITAEAPHDDGCYQSAEDCGIDGAVLIVELMVEYGSRLKQNTVTGHA